MSVSLEKMACLVTSIYAGLAGKLSENADGRRARVFAAWLDV
jgi:hypothetical protein